MLAGANGQRRPADVIGNAVPVVKIATGEIEEGAPIEDGKNPAAKVPKGGTARAKAMTPERRTEIATKADAKRWAGSRG